MSIRRRRLLYRIAQISLVIISVIYILRKPVSAIDKTLHVVDALLDKALDETLLQHSVTRRRYASVIDVDTILAIKTTQDALACYVEQGDWYDLSGNDRLSKMPYYVPKDSCSHHFQSHLNGLSAAAQLCSFLSAKNILFVGPESTFYLHSLWLNAQERQENRSHSCLGPEFCTFHHICRQSSDTVGTIKSTVDRIKKRPTERELIDSDSAIFRYVPSSTLHTSNKPKDPVYHLPFVDSQTGVRVRNAYWLHQARKADIVVMNRGPIPAPAWSYSNSNLEGNWTFVDELYLNSTTVYVDNIESFSTRVINAALHVTLTVFLPSLGDTLLALLSDRKIRQNLLVWHSSWYLQPSCSTVDLPKNIPVVADLVRPPSVTDPWTTYYNAQVYMHNRLLRKLLPHYGVIFLPLTIPPGPVHINIMETSKYAQDANIIATAGTKRKDCLRYPFAAPGGKALEVGFLGAMSLLVEQTM